MDKLPFMPWYPADYKGDTSHLTDTEDLIYRRLLDELWIARGALAFDEARIARRVRVTPGKFRKVWATIGAFFRVEGGQITHKRISAEIEKSQKIIEKRSKAGTKAAQKRWGKSKENNGTPVTNAKANVCHPEPQGSGKPLNRVYHEPRETEKIDLAAEPDTPARESGGGAGSYDAAKSEAWSKLRAALARPGGPLSIVESRKLGQAIHGFDDNVFLISHEPFEPQHWQAVQRGAEAEGFGFEVCQPAKLKAIDGGKP